MLVRLFKVNMYFDNNCFCDNVLPLKNSCSLRGTCKHVAALCHYVIERVAHGDNATVTEKRQIWHAPSKKKTHPPEFLSNIRIQKLQGKAKH